MANPAIPADVMAWLLKTYPPKCRMRGESELSHERYAGKVELVADIKALYDEQLAPDVVIDKDGNPEGLGGLTFEEAYGDD